PEILARPKFADEAQLASARHRDQSSAFDGGDEEKRPADEPMLAARFEIVRVSPKRREDRLSCLERIDALLGHAEIGGAAGDLDIGNEETHLRRVDIEGGRLDIDR